jgi:D-alanyl-D-alanine carboxypeptidase
MVIVVALVLAAALLALNLAGGAGLAPNGLVAAAPSAPPVDVATSPPTALASAAPSSSSPPASAPATSEPATPEPASPPPSAPASTAPEPGESPDPSATPGVGPVPGIQGVPHHQLQARLDKARAKLEIPGVSVAIVWDDGRAWTGASGFRDVAKGDPMTTDTAFALASVSKTLTAAVVLQLVDEGVLRLDQKVAPLLPEYPMHRKVTVRELLDHTSGLPDYFLNGKIDRPLQSDKDVAWSAAEAWDYVLPPRKRYAPGRIWYYSNTNYLLLGELVERVTGRPLAEQVRSRLLDPLAMESSWYQDAEEPRAHGTQSYRLVPQLDGSVRAVRVAKQSDVMQFRSVVTAAGGAGSIAATALDAAHWMQAYARGDILSPAMHRAMLADIANTRKLNAEIPYGLGIQAVPLGGRPAFGHSGRFLGFRNVVRYLPLGGVTIAVLTNQGVADPSKVADKLLDVILPTLPSIPGDTGIGSGKPKPTP